MDFTNLKNFMDHLTAELVPGNSIIVYKDGKKVFTYSSGYADLENKVPMKGDELFNIYSCSKPILVTAALQLWEQGKLLLTDPLYTYLPEFRDMLVRNYSGALVPAKNQITIQNLFTMTAGFNYGNAFFDKLREQKSIGATREAMRTFAELPLNFEPGTHWCYSYAHDVLAAVVEVISGQKYRDYVREHIFEPLGMEGYFHLTPELEGRMAQQYRYEFTGEQTGNSAAIPAGKAKNIGLGNWLVYGPEYDSGGAGVITSVEEYGKFAAAIANRGTGLNGARILAPSTVDLMQRDQLTDVQRADFLSAGACRVGYSYGLGVRTVIDPSGAPGADFGWGGAAGSDVYCDTQANIAIFYAQHMLNPQPNYFRQRLRNAAYSCL